MVIDHRDWRHVVNDKHRVSVSFLTCWIDIRMRGGPMYRVTRVADVVYINRVLSWEGWSSLEIPGMCDVDVI